jgi:PAS domain S-box-containing protein
MLTLLDKDIGMYKELIECANVIINAFDASGNVLIWNKASEEITGYKKKEAIGNKKIMELLYPDAEYRSEVLKSIGTGFKNNYKNVEFILKTKYGDKKSISWSAVLVKNAKGESVGSFAVGIDVSIKNVVKERERESFRALLKSVRFHEDIKQKYEVLIQQLREEVNSLCKDLSRPPKY